MFNDWREYRNTSSDLESVECDIEDVQNLSKQLLSTAVCKFITEVKKVDGSDFPSRTMYDIVICLQFWLESNGLNWKLISEFSDVKWTLDNVMKIHYQQGVGNKVRQAEIVSFSDEELMWSLGLLGMHNPQGLLNTLVYSLGLHCALHAGKEHRVLRSIPFNSQFKFMQDSTGGNFVRYTEDVSLKTNKGRLKQRKVDVKTVDIYPCANLERCPIEILWKYLSVLPPDHKSQALYLQPKKNYSSSVWYLDQPVGVHTLRNTVRELCKKAGINGFGTNHSLRSSSATRMYGEGVPEQVIQEITGHRSLCVCKYKRTSDIQCKIASGTIAGNSNLK